MGGHRRISVSVLTGLAALLLLGGTAVADPLRQSRVCTRIDVSVALAEGRPTDQHLKGQLCEPTDADASTIQLLVHGITYDRSYWSFPDPSGGTNRYNYVAHANAAGFATLAIDRLGSGESSHPLSTELTVGSNAYTVHQVVQALRRGDITRANGQRFQKIVYVGHSYGTWVGWTEVSKYRDVDAAVFTAAFSKAAITGLANTLPNLYPAALDPRFRDRGLDAGYLTTRPNTRYATFYSPADVDPAVVRYDEDTKSTVTASELADFPHTLTKTHDIRVPVFLVTGIDDSLFCRENTAPYPAGHELEAATHPLEDRTAPQSGDLTGLRFGGTRCDDPHSLIADERRHLGSRIPAIDAFVLEGAGHDVNQARSAEHFFAATQEWIHRTIGGQ